MEAWRRLRDAIRRADTTKHPLFRCPDCNEHYEDLSTGCSHCDGQLERTAYSYAAFGYLYR
jgi:DNA polymerase II large subunit